MKNGLFEAVFHNFIIKTTRKENLVIVLYTLAESSRGQPNNNFKPFMKSLSPLYLQRFKYTSATFQNAVLGVFKLQGS